MKKILFIKISAIPPTKGLAEVIQEFLGPDYLLIFAEIDKTVEVFEV